MSSPLEIIPPKPAPLLLSYLRLFRLPNVFTAMADVAMGYLFVEHTIVRIDVFLCLVGASSLLYTAGMVLNDVYDLEVDAKERPGRPLPSGRISAAWAKWLGYELLLVGLALGWLAGIGMFGLTAAGFKSGTVATALALCIVLYDVGLKKTFAGPLGMGACRFLNVLLGMSIHGASRLGGPEDLDIFRIIGFSPPELMIAGGIGVYISGVTWFARSEAEKSNPLQLAFGMAVMIGGVVMLAFFPDASPQDIILQFKNNNKYIWYLLLLLVTLTPLRRCGAAVLNPTPQRVQIAVKLSIMTLIVLDAAVVMAVAGPYYALGVLALLGPAWLLGKWVYST